MQDVILTNISVERKLNIGLRIKPCIEIGLHDGSSINFQSKNDGTLQLICQPSSQIIEARNDGILMLFGRADPKVYLINNEDFHRYVINLCSGGDTALATKSE